MENENTPLFKETVDDADIWKHTPFRRFFFFLDKGA